MRQYNNPVNLFEVVSSESSVHANSNFRNTYFFIVKNGWGDASNGGWNA